MEAIAKYDFRATNGDELSFTKGTKLKIINMDVDPNWFKAELRGQEGHVPINYIEMSPNEWFAKNVGRTLAETKLMDKSANRYVHEVGSFLIRPSEASPGEFSMSVKLQNSCQHYKILKDAHGSYYIWDRKFPTLNQLVDFYRSASVDQKQTVYLKDMAKKQTKVVANYDFEPQDPNELRLRRGDIVTVTDDSDADWWTGEIMRGANVMRGLFPKTYVSNYSD